MSPTSWQKLLPLLPVDDGDDGWPSRGGEERRRPAGAGGETCSYRGHLLLSNPVAADTAMAALSSCSTSSSPKTECKISAAGLAFRRLVGEPGGPSSLENRDDGDWPSRRLMGTLLPIVSPSPISIPDQLDLPASADWQCPAFR